MDWSFRGCELGCVDANRCSLSKEILYDARWVGNHGIGRFAGELRKLLPGLVDYQADRRPWHPLDTALLGAMLWRRRPRLFFSPGCNPPVGWPHPFVFTLHDLHHLCVPEDSSVAKRAYYNHVIRPACHKAAFVLTVSEYSKNAIREWSGINEQKIINVGNGVGLPFTASGARFDPGFPYLLYVGSRKPHKNLERLLKAFAISGVRGEVRLLLTGTQDAEISAHIESLGMNGQVVFKQTTRDADLADLYRGATGFLFPSLYEGFGLPPMEAMACGVPVLTSDVCAIPEIVGDAALLVNPRDVEAIAEGIRQLVGEGSLREEMRKKGFERVRRFSWDETARRAWEVLQCAAT
jgi:glycosyltransferase involved in cell wall biosynthesis